ncbi:MAG: hypothetical protein JW832_10595, partial [Deltaproteobacteria bacterium]|nr:hypothetical protein [Deltaproteobacteria bacterium]
FLRQLIGWSLHKQHNDSEAAVNLSKALFFNATACRETYLPEESFRTTLHALRREDASPEMAWIRLPVELWRAKIITVHPEDTYAACLFPPRAFSRCRNSSATARSTDFF